VSSVTPPWEALARGADLFNQGLYWEAHEAWEELWLALEDEERLFVQGLIQVAAAGHKAFVQNQPRGCVKLLTTALEKLDRAPRDFLGVETARFIPALHRMLAEAQRWSQGQVAGLRRPVVPPVVLLSGAPERR
jgi:predicted metal-dependent hydrolase